MAIWFLIWFETFYSYIYFVLFNISAIQVHYHIWMETRILIIFSMHLPIATSPERGFSLQRFFIAIKSGHFENWTIWIPNPKVPGPFNDSDFVFQYSDVENLVSFYKMLHPSEIVGFQNVSEMFHYITNSH
jgi:hypothetical protein